MNSEANLPQSYDGVAFDTEIEFPTNNFIMDSSDSDLFNFKYFLSEDLTDSSLINSSPNSYGDSSISSPSNSPQPSPLQQNEDNFTHSAPTDFLLDNNVYSLEVQDPLLLPVKQEEKNSVPTFTISPTTMNPNLLHDAKTDGKTKVSRKRERTTNKDTVVSVDGLIGTNKEVYTPHLIGNGRQLSVDEEKQMKRQKRLIKNRESAQLSRLRKKIYIEELERKVTSLTNETEGLTKQVQILTNDKKKLQEEVVYLCNVIKQSPDLSVVLSKRNTLTNNNGIGLPNKNMKAAGVCLLIMLFSIGLLFNAKDHTIKIPSRTREEIPEVIPKTTTTAKTIYAGRVLQSIEEVEITNNKIQKVLNEIQEEEEEEEKVVIRTTIGKKHSRYNNVQDELDEEEIESYSDVSEDSDNSDYEYDLDTLKYKPLLSRKRVKITDKKNINDNNNNNNNNNNGDRLSLAPVEETIMKTSDNQLVLRRDPSASYIYCPDAFHVPPTVVTNSGPEMIALLIPASVLNNSAMANQAGIDQRSLLEISCSVLNLHMWPMQNNTNTPTTAS